MRRATRCMYKLTLLAALGNMGFAQQMGSSWIGSWGAFHRVAQSDQRAVRADGQGLTISDCSGSGCEILFQVQGERWHAGGKGELEIETDAHAVARLGVPAKCTLALDKSQEPQPAITVTRETGDCSYFETPGASFEHTYPLRSRTPFASALFLPDCFVGDSRAQMALCASPVLAQQETDWISLVWSDMALGPPKLDMHTERGKLLKSCDAAPDPGGCMGAAFRESADALKARTTAWKASVTEPGDPKRAERAIAAVAGIYRHSFANGDVQGDKFTSVDTLKIRRASADSIYYDVYLEFFNGHQCNRTGVAKYRINGSFVDQTQVELPSGPSKLCAFEIIPNAGGVQLRDATGMCKMESCGERGGFNGQGFASSDRVDAVRARNKAQANSSVSDRRSRR